jgi:hypothetical protein
MSNFEILDSTGQVPLWKTLVKPAFLLSIGVHALLLIPLFGQQEEVPSSAVQEGAVNPNQPVDQSSEPPTDAIDNPNWFPGDPLPPVNQGGTSGSSEPVNTPTDSNPPVEGGTTPPDSPSSTGGETTSTPTSTDSTPPVESDTTPSPDPEPDSQKSSPPSTEVSPKPIDGVTPKPVKKESPKPVSNNSSSSKPKVTSSIPHRSVTKKVRTNSSVAIANKLPRKKTIPTPPSTAIANRLPQKKIESSTPVAKNTSFQDFPKYPNSTSGNFDLTILLKNSQQTIDSIGRVGNFFEKEMTNRGYKTQTEVDTENKRIYKINKNGSSKYLTLVKVPKKGTIITLSETPVFHP